MKTFSIKEAQEDKPVPPPMAERTYIRAISGVDSQLVVVTKHVDLDGDPITVALDAHPILVKQVNEAVGRGENVGEELAPHIERILNAHWN